MKTLIYSLLLGLSFGAQVFSDNATPAPAAPGSPGYHWVNPHVTKGDVYVTGHYQTNPNGTKSDNWSAKGNANPFTGKPGSK